MEYQNFQILSEEELNKFVFNTEYEDSERKKETISSYYSKLFNEIKKEEQELKSLKEAFTLIKSNDIDINKDEYLIRYEGKKKALEELLSYRELLFHFIEEKRKICVHKWEYDGHDSHYDYYKCPHCGAEDKE